MENTLLIGIGNPFLGDDRVGLEVVERVKREGCPWNIEVLYNVGFDLLDKILGYEKVIIIDACKYGGPIGNVLILNKDDLLNQRVYSINTHGFTLSHIIELGQTLYPELMPSYLKVILVEANRIEDFSQSFSPEVMNAIDRVVKYLKELWEKDIKKHRG